MRWEKLGRVFKPDQDHAWIKTHAQVPACYYIESEDIVRVFFSSRPTPNSTRIAYLDLDAQNLFDVKFVSEEPLIDLGNPGTFDEHGTMPSSIVKNGNYLFMYYSGWQRSVGVPYNNYTGLAISHDEGKTFQKHSQVPILDRNKNELFSATSPFVLRENDRWIMWYCSGTHWHQINGKMEHTYDIKVALSNDGISWDQTGIIAIHQTDPFEAITKPTVVKLNGKYHMWFCYRGSKDFRDGNESYKIGYASSSNGISWSREDGISGIEKSAQGWDSTMIAYPEILKVKDQYFMFYNGNGFGKEGFGVAKLIL